MSGMAVDKTGFIPNFAVMSQIVIPEISKTATCRGHQDCIYTLENEPASNLFWTAGADGMIVQWNTTDPDNGEVVAKMNATVYAMHHLPGDGLLVVGQNFDGIHLIDPKERKQVRSLSLTEAAIFAMQSLGDRLFVACGDGMLHVVDLQDWHIIAKMKIAEKSLRSMALNPACTELAIGCSDHTVRIISTDDLRELLTITDASNSVFAVRFSPDGKWLYTSGRDAHLRIYDVAEGYALQTDIIPHMYTVNDILFRPSGDVFATCSKDKSIRIWDPIGTRSLKTIDRLSHAGHGTSVNRLLWKDDHTLISVSDDRTVSIWDIDFGG